MRILVCFCAILTAFTFETASMQFRVLVFTKTAGFHHDSMPAGIQAIGSLGYRCGFDVEDTAEFATARANGQSPM